VVEVDLSKVGLKHIATLQTYGSIVGLRPGPSELFQNQTPMTIARWPKTGYAKVVSVSDPGAPAAGPTKLMHKPVLSIGDRAKLWANDKDAWLYGYWKYDWSDENIKVEQIAPSTGEVTLQWPHVYGVADGAEFYAQNLIEELDSPGDYYIDSSTLHLYFIPARKIERDDVFTLSVVQHPLLNVAFANGLTIRGLDFAFTCGNAVAVFGGGHVRFEGCRFTNLGELAGTFDGSSNSGFQSCDIWNTGEGGVTISAGDRNSLQAGNNFVDNCDIHDVNRFARAYRPAVRIEGVGNRVSHCFIHEGPHNAILFSGNDEIIEYNQISQMLSRTADGGAIYTGRDWSEYGNTVGYNWIHDNVGKKQQESGVYIDDLGAGISIIGNLFERCHYACLVGGGHDNVLQDNIVVDCDTAFFCDARGLTWDKGARPTLMKTLDAVPYRSPLWKSRYPSLEKVTVTDPMSPYGNTLSDNVLIGSGTMKSAIQWQFAQTAKLEGNREEKLPKSSDTAIIEEIRKESGVFQDALRNMLGPQGKELIGSVGPNHEKSTMRFAASCISISGIMARRGRRLCVGDRSVEGDFEYFDR